ncbi:MAG TPA: hypothetical protein VN923_20410, partial [Thermoanaerobaculia bacterium]|nr:hypothetical protein [Thermoanaerobaculia bacterium]
AGFREQENSSVTVWPKGRNTIHYCDDPEDIFCHVARFSRNRTLATKTEYTSAWLQDTVTLGRWTLAAGLRYDKQSGENLPSVSPANPQAQGLVPELRFNGNDAGGFEWKTIVPRLSATLALGAERSTLARASFSRYAQQLGQNRITFVNPAGSYSYAYFYFADSNGNQLLDPAEQGSLTYGYVYNIDTSNPSSLVSANVNDPDLEPAMTDEVVLGLEHSFRDDLAGSLTATWRRTTDVIEDTWGLVVDPTSGLIRPWVRSDFEQLTDDDGNPVFVTGTLPNGSTRSAPVFHLRDDVTYTNGTFITNSDSEHEYTGLTAAIQKRLKNHWSARGSVTWNDWNWSNGPQSRLHEDPTNETDDWFTLTGDDDIYAEASGGAKSDVFVGSNWSFGLSGLYQIAPERPWGFNIAANLTGRQGYGSPPTFRIRRGDPGRADVELSDGIDEFRNDDIIMLDGRIEKEIKTGGLTWLLGIDGFNLLNEDYVLQRQRRLDLDSGNNVKERLSPRIFRFGVTLRWH